MSLFCQSSFVHVVLLQDIVDLVGAAFREPEISYKPRGNHGDEVGDDWDDDHL